jgi:hypothetical protein
MTRYDFLSVLTSLEIELLKLTPRGENLPEDGSARGLREAWDRTARLFRRACPQEEVPVPFWKASNAPGDLEPVAMSQGTGGLTRLNASASSTA